jgi:hypothetical protein
MDILRGLPTSSRRTLLQLFERVKRTPRRVRFNFDRWIVMTMAPALKLIDQMKNDGRISDSRAEELTQAYVDEVRNFMLSYIGWLQARVARTRRLK